MCVATTVNMVTPRATQRQSGAELAQAVELDMAAWWTPTTEGYFRHVSKTVILEAVAEFAPEHATHLAKLKKADSASEAERLSGGTGWMPAMFRTEQHMEQEGVSDATSDTDAPEDSADAVEAHALAA